MHISLPTLVRFRHLPIGDLSEICGDILRAVRFRGNVVRAGWQGLQ